MLLMCYTLQTSKTDEILTHDIIYKVIITADMSNSSRRRSSSGRSNSIVVAQSNSSDNSRVAVTAGVVD